MSGTGDRWHHVTINTLGAWLHGSPRGFRDRRHRIHSSGDYKHPPPPGEHAGLHAYYRQRSRGVVVIPPRLRPAIVDALIRKIRSQDRDLLALCVGAAHAHLLVMVPPHTRAIKRIAGTWKQAASHAVRLDLPGKVWSAGCDAEPIHDHAYQQKVFFYILEHVREGASVRHFRDSQDPPLREASGTA